MLTSSKNLNIALPFYRSTESRPDQIALALSGFELSYAQAAQRVREVASELEAGGVRRGSRVGLLASRSIEACIGVLGTAWCGATYVPVGLKLPEERLLKVFELAKFDAVIADSKGVALLSPRILEACPHLILVPDADAAESFKQAGRNVRSLDRLPRSDSLSAPAFMAADDVAYIEFTSGTTGVPKGVMVQASAVDHYVTVMQQCYTFVPDDRIAETTELSFDLSVSNMFSAWNAGAGLHIVPQTDSLAPAKFIRDNKISVWLSVPSVITMMKRVKALRPGGLPSLRYSFFCGEPFPLSAALAWQEAACNSIVDNLYGPTEATVWCIGQRLTNPPLTTPQREVLAIGTPLRGMAAAIVDADLKFLKPGEPGELALAGPQLAAGYYGAEELTAQRFPTIGGKRWYLTGDLAFQDDAGLFHHLGRLDNQIKVLGNRVELEDIEFHLRAVCETELVAVVPWPMSHGSADGIVGFVAGRDLPVTTIKSGLQARLPSYMVPSIIHMVETLPLNANGKLDRKALIAQLSGG